MAFLKLKTITLFCCFVIVKTENSNTGKEDSFSKISSVLDYLNSNSNGVYEYKSGSLVSAQNRADIIEITVDVNVDCLKTYPEIPCNEHGLMCHAFIRLNPDRTYQVLSDVKCSPKDEMIVEDMDEAKSVSPAVFMEQNQREMEKIDLSSEALSLDQGGADFVAVRKDIIPCLGCPFDLNTDAEGVDELINTAVKHIESERSQRHKILNVRRLQQQVVAGIKYILLAEVAPTTCAKDADLSAPCIVDTSLEPFICEITFIEKPWITKSKHIIKNNCTESQEFEPVDLSKRDQDDMNNEILPHGDFIHPKPEEKPKPIPNYDVIAQTGNIEEDMDAARLADLESQILISDMFESPKDSKVVQGSNTPMPSTALEPEYMSVDEPSPVTTAIDDSLKVEPLNIENRHLYRIPLFSFVQMIDASEPVVTMYDYQNNEPLKNSDENTVSKEIKNVETVEFEKYFPDQEKFKRELTGDSDSDSNGSLEVSKDKVKIEVVDGVRRDVAHSSEESSESQNTAEKRKRVRREINTSGKSELSNSIEEKTKKVKRSNAPNNNDSSSSSSSSEENNNIEENRKSKQDNHNDDTSSSSSSSSSTGEEPKNQRHKRSIGQMEKISSDEKVIVRDLADFAAATLDNIDDDHHKRVILQILGAKKLKLDGIYYQIILRLGISHCHEHEHNENCREKLLTNLTKICKVQVHVDDDYSNPKVVKSQCQNIKKDENDRNRTNYSRYRRSVLVGGRTPMSTSDPRLKEFLNATLEHLDSTSSHPNKYKAIQIVNATSQVVAGARYDFIIEIGLSNCAKTEERPSETCNLLEDSKIETCTIDVWERSWLNKTIYHANCNDREYNFGAKEGGTRKKRALKGAPIPKYADELANHFYGSVLYLDSKSEHENKFIVDKVLSASRQVVAGTLTKIQASLALTDCKKGSELKNCTILNDSLNRPMVCTFIIWEQPWLNFTQTNITCDNNQIHSFRSKRAIDGWSGPQLLAPNNIPKDAEEVVNHLERSVLYLDSKSEHENKFIVDEVLSASRQVVAGTLTRIRASLAISDCKKGSELKNCTKLNDSLSTPIVCNFKIWEQPWLNFTQTNITCDNNQRHSFRSKRAIDGWNGPQLLGADEELSTEHIEAKNFIKMALEYLSSKSETPGKYELQDIKKVSRRIVAGSLWDINADIALCRQIDLLRSTYSMCPDPSQHINCQFKVFNQPWLADGLTINITCINDDQVYIYAPVKGLVEDEELNTFDYKEAFKQFVKKYNKVYGDGEYSYRLKVFRDNANKIALLNKYEKGTAQYGFTRFADMTEKEFSQSHGYRPDLQNENEVPFARAEIPSVKLPKEFDWRTKNAVTEVKDQGMCGSCWAFSVTGNVEGQYAIKHGQLLEFSEQELVDCDKVDEGCNGGLMDNAYRVIEKLGGLETESDYPYEGDDEKCHFNINKVKVELTGALNISHNETDMAKWLVQNGPISIAINANAMQFYMGGVSHPWKTLCNPKNLDHGVLIVGYGVHQYSLFNKTLPYWIVKNSWGPSWGEQGYYRVFRGDGTCGLNQTPSSAIVA